VCAYLSSETCKGERKKNDFHTFVDVLKCPSIEFQCQLNPICLILFICRSLNKLKPIHYL